MTVVGLQWVQSTNTYSCPAADSIGSLTPATRIAACNSIDPWMSMVRCNLWDTGVQTANYGDRCYTDTGVANMGQVMVKLKKFWYATDFTVAGTYKWYISSTGADSLPANVGAWKVHPAFLRNYPTVPAKNQIYLGAYEGYYDGVSKLESLAGVTPTASQQLATFRTQAEARGTGWEMQDYLTICAVQLLYLLEYGGFNAQSLLSVGITNITSESHRVGGCLTGHTTSLGNNSGQVTFTTSAADGLVAPDTGTATQAMSYRGIENFYGNIKKWVDGVNMQSGSTVWVADHGFVSDTFTSPYVNTTLTLTSSEGYILDINMFTSTYDYGFLPSSVTGNTTPFNSTGLCCLYYDSAGGNSSFVQSDTWTSTTWAGMFGVLTAYNQYNSYNFVGARLMYVG